MNRNRLKPLKWIVLFLLIFLLWQIYQWYNEPKEVVLNNGTRLEWTTCWFEIPLSKKLFNKVHCGYLWPSDNQTDNQTLIQLPIVMIENRFRFWPHNTGPILYLSGGPGYPTGLDKESMALWWIWLEMNDWSHDFVLFDQRGTGLSQPQLDCPEVLSISRNLLNQSLTREKEFALELSAVKQCYQRLSEAGIDLSNYTTLTNTHDVGDLMAAIGGSNWNIYGVSYGSRLALSVINTYPERVRSVILDAVYPLEINELLETPFLYDNALSILFNSCQTNEVCQSTFGHFLETAFFELLKQLRETPIELTVSKAEELISFRINDHRFMDIIFQALYRWDFIEMLPSAIISAREGDYEALRPFVQFYVDWLFDTAFSDAVYLSVECHDSFPNTTREQYMTQVLQFPRIKEFVRYHWDYNPCSVWPVGHADPTVHKPIKSDIPTLFLVGEYDPITPPIWAQQAAQHFSQGQVFVFSGIGHGVVDSDYCASKLVQTFLFNPKQRPHDECLLEFERPEFLFDFE